MSMRTTITFDKELLDKAIEFSGLPDRSALIRAALKALIAQESAKRLAALGGSEPQLTLPARRRPDAS